MTSFLGFGVCLCIFALLQSCSGLKFPAKVPMRGLSSRIRDWETSKTNQQLNMLCVDSETAVGKQSVGVAAGSLLQHTQLVEGKLSNGFTYKILPNSVPSGRFEAHLEVMSGSASELNSQQGMAHLLEHVAYMGSPKRQLLSGTGSRTNAYTDFHHTVFFAACPTETPDSFWKKPMLPAALDALLDVMTTVVDDDRLEKERAAVLSEASMVNKMDYRVECQILSALHAENRISQRFPIGKENLIKSWTKEDVQVYHDTHYQPENVILFVVGDVDVASTVETIKQKFGHLQPKVNLTKFLQTPGEFPAINMRSASRHFPPVTHKWSCSTAEATRLLPASLVGRKISVSGSGAGIDESAAPPDLGKLSSGFDYVDNGREAFTIVEPKKKYGSSSSLATSHKADTSIDKNRSSSMDSASTSLLGPPSHTNTVSTSTITRTSSSSSSPPVQIYAHELLQSFSFHLFAKRPIEPITSEAALRRSLLRRMAVSALQIRLNVQQRQDQLFNFLDFNQLNWPREGCSVCSLDLTTG
jgi:hypothetical protein